MSLRVLHVLDHSIPLHSGYTFRTLSLLKEQRKLGWETFHVTSPKHVGARGDEEVVDGRTFYRTPMPATSFEGVPGLHEWRLMQALRARLFHVATQVRPNIIHAHSPVLNALPALSVGRELGIPVVYEVRAFWEDAAVDHGTATEGNLRYRLTRGLETHALRRVAHIFTICEGLKNDILGRGIDSAKVTVIPNAVDLDTFDVGRPPDEELRAALGLRGHTVVGFVGSFYAYEGLDLLVDALPGILAVQPDVRLLLVGGGPQEAALKARAGELGIADKVVFTGRVPHDRVGAYYDLIDVLAYPRHRMRLTDLVTPLKPLEAMAQGRVFMASDVGGHRELVRDRETGWLFEAGSVTALQNALTGLLKGRDMWTRLRENGRRFVEQERTWASSAANYVAPYHRLAGG